MTRTIVFGLLAGLIAVAGCGPGGRGMSEQEQIRAERQALRQEYGRLSDEVAGILFQWDPIGINFEENTDEYEPEARTILPRLSSCSSVTDARRVIHEEFAHWFGPETAGPETKYQEAAEQIWAAWQRSKSNDA